MTTWWPFTQLATLVIVGFLFAYYMCLTLNNIERLLRSLIKLKSDEIENDRLRRKFSGHFE